MIDYIMKAIAAIFFFGFSYFFYRIIKDAERINDYERELLHDANANIFNAEIIKRFHKDTTYYVVRFEDKGKTIEARTTRYKQVRKKYAEGDTVPVKYYLTEGGREKALIVDDELVLSGGNSNVSKIVFVVNKLFLLAAIYFVVRAFIG